MNDIGNKLHGGNGSWASNLGSVNSAYLPGMAELDIKRISNMPITKSPGYDQMRMRDIKQCWSLKWHLPRNI